MRVDCSRTVRKFAANPSGFCMSFLTDDDAPGRPPFGEVLAGMRVGSLRYPMGTLGENYLFHDPRAGAPVKGKLRPRVVNSSRPPARWDWAVRDDGSFREGILDFDEFVRLCRAARAEPVVLVPSHGHLFDGSAFTEEDVVRHAGEWVRYSNVTCRYGVAYWEVGNEVDLRHPREVMPKDAYMAIYRRIASRMKAADPAVRVGLGVSGNVEYYSDALRRFPELVDFVVVHQYMGRVRDYDSYKRLRGPLMTKVRSAAAAIDRHAPPGRRKTTEILVTEYSSFCAGAKSVPPDRRRNSILNALVTFEMLAECAAADARVRFTHFWVTHSPWGDRKGTDYANAFGPDNAVLPQGRAVEAMGRFVRDRIVHADCASRTVRAWASTSEDARALTVWVVNRDLREAEVELEIEGLRGDPEARVWRLKGRDPDDERPFWGPDGTLGIERPRTRVTLPPLSLSILLFGGEPGGR
jgi:hypothetical protein